MPASRHALAALCFWGAHGVTVEPVQVSVPIASDPDKEDFFQEVGFTSEVGQDRHVNGHFLKLPNSRGRFFVSPPLPGGCGTVNQPAESAKLHDPPCKYVVNGGFFDCHSERAIAGGIFDCIGNLVSDGQVIHTQPYNESNVQFGVRNGRYVIGYIDPAVDQNFEQLIEGMGWMVRNGKNNVRPPEAGGLANATGWSEAYQAAGSGGAGYGAVVSGRVGLGYNALGELLILKTDGHTSPLPKWGANMYELADKMIELGAIEAISLDGGGSAQMLYNGIEVGYSSDRIAGGALEHTYSPACPIGNATTGLSPFECPRAVSSFVCISEAPEAAPRAGVFEGPLFMVLVALGGGAGVLAIAYVAWKRGSRKEGMLSDSDGDEERTS